VLLSLKMLYDCGIFSVNVPLIKASLSLIVMTKNGKTDKEIAC